MSSPPGDVTVVIPVLNGAPEIRACIEGILEQSIRPRQIIAIDSGSTDDTLSILDEYPEVDVVHLPAAEFNHGETRNLGVRLATAEFVLFTVQDARPAGSNWIVEMLRGFTDEEVAAVCGDQIVPHDRDKNPLEWFRPSSEPKLVRYQFKDSAEFEQLSPAERRRVCGLDNVTAMYRREVLTAIPFRQTSYAEDMIWARDAIGLGHALVYNPAARVYHYHHETPDFVFRRALASVYHGYRSIGLIPEQQPLMWPMLRAVGRLVREPGIGWGERAYWARRTISTRRAVRSAIRLFRAELADGNSDVDALYERYCDRLPIPAKSLR